MAKDIGAGCRVYMGDSAAPMNTANGGGGSDADLDDVTDYLPEASIASAMETADITTLNVDASGFARRFIAALINNTASASYTDSTTLAFFTRIFNIRTGTVHTKGRGKVDVRIRPTGAASGRPQLDFTAIVTDFGLNITIADPLGGPCGMQIDGAVTLALQA